MHRPRPVDRTLACIPLFGDERLPTSSVTNPNWPFQLSAGAITDLDHCTSTEDALQHMCTPSDRVSVVAMMDRLVSNDSLDPSLSNVACSVVATTDRLVRVASPPSLLLSTRGRRWVKHCIRGSQSSRSVSIPLTQGNMSTEFALM